MRRLVFLLCISVLVASVRADVFTDNAVPQRWLEPFLPESLPDLTYPAYFNDLDKARLEAFTGRYKKALYSLMRAATTVKDADPVEVAVIRGEALLALGRLEQAIETLSQPKLQDEPRVQVLRARVLAASGKDQDAVALLRTHITRHPQSIAGRYWLGAIQEQAGEIEAAKNAFAWFVVEPQSFLEKWRRDHEKGFDDAEQVTYIGRALDRWASLNSAYKDMPGLHDTLLGMFVRAYDVIDRAYWPAHVAAAEYFLSHDNAAEATKELTAALRQNPRHARSAELLGTIALERFDFDKVDAIVDHLRTIDRDSIEGDLMQARNLLAQRLPERSMEPIKRALAKQPRRLEALGLKAAVHALRLEHDELRQALAQADRIAPQSGVAYFEVAEQLGAMRQYPRAIEMYQQAIERSPWWTHARNNLGLLYTQSGDEDLAYATLDAAHELDPYNLRTTNYLRLLDDLRKYERKETKNFVVLYDKEQDPIIPEFFAEYLQSIHAEVTSNFRHEPPVTTYIEVFPSHDAFSVRTTGSPWIGTVGASTGRVIAMVSPRKGENTMGAFHWAQVLRHEYTHTVTLSATENRIPHWMTEGLAVYEERVPLRWDWVPMLYHAVKEKELFTMQNLTWGFVRPKKPSDRQLAYAQSYWVCKFIEEKQGFAAILKMMDLFREGRSEEEVFRQVLGKDLGEFTDDFFAWAEAQVALWGYDEESTKRYDELREKGESLIKARQYAEAVPVWEEIATIRPVDALPHQRLAGLYLSKPVNQPGKAIEHLKALAAVEIKDNRYAKRIARLHRDQDQLPQAIEFATQAIYIDPYDADAHELAAELLEKSGDAKRAARHRLALNTLKQMKQMKQNAQN